MYHTGEAIDPRMLNEYIEIEAWYHLQTLWLFELGEHNNPNEHRQISKILSCQYY